jgi:hypothetical protein
MNGRSADRKTGRVIPGQPESERHPGLRPIAVAAARLAASIMAHRGGAGVLARLKVEWSAVAGAELAARTWPERLGRDGALKLRVSPEFALDLQHRAPIVVDRINLFFGRAVVGRLVLLQGPLPLRGPASGMPAPALTGEETRALDSRLAGVADPELRAALAGLGRLVLSAARQTG